MTLAPRLPSAVLSEVARVLCGDWCEGEEQPSPYRSHDDLRHFFRCDLGLEYGGTGWASRLGAVQDVLIDRNGTAKLGEIIEAAVHPANYAQSECAPASAAEYLNRALASCGYRLEWQGRAYCLVEANAEPTIAAPSSDSISTDYIREVADKAEKRLHQEDYEGAVTAARTLVESVLVEIEQRIAGRRRDHERDLPGQFTVVRKLLKIDEEGRDLDDSFKTMIKGLVLIVNGLAPLRNKAGDSHARTRKPAPHHARFAVNAAKTVAYFLVESYTFQLERGVIQEAQAQREPA